MKASILFTDGASSGNPGPGGWGAVLLEPIILDNEDIKPIEKTRVLEYGGGESRTTNNRMELTAVIEGLSKADVKKIIIFSDSKYVIGGINWMRNWKENGWKTKAKTDVKNKDLWEKLSGQIDSKDIEWKFVEGHRGVLGNERADDIAQAFSQEQEVKLKNVPYANYSINLLDLTINNNKKGSKKGKAYSYVSSIDGEVKVHKSWDECKKRVEGKNAQFRKVFSKEEEEELIRRWRK